VVAPVTDDGALDLAALEGCIGPRTRAVSVTWVSNALGTVNPIERIVSLAHDRDIPVIVDAAQAAPHLDIDVVALNCDFLALSGHKMFGPSGIGILYGRADRLAPLPPWQGGGEMIRNVRFEGSEYADPPARFEAGTPALAGAVGLAAAADWLTAMDRAEARSHEAELHRHLVEVLLALPDARLVGTAPDRIAVQSFVLPGIDSHELALLADQHGVAVRSGHHCAQPLLEHFGLTATVRASVAPYNTHDDIERLAQALTDARSMLG
jgi:cysteine desulfurase/selenocysteine lyase